MSLILSVLLVLLLLLLLGDGWIGGKTKSEKKLANHRAGSWVSVLIDCVGESMFLLDDVS